MGDLIIALLLRRTIPWMGVHSGYGVLYDHPQMLSKLSVSSIRPAGCASSLATALKMASEIDANKVRKQSRILAIRGVLIGSRVNALLSQLDEGLRVLMFSPNVKPQE